MKAERCLVCGSKHHKVKDCPRRQQEGGQDGQVAGGLNKKEARLAQAKAKPGPLSTSSRPPIAKAASLATTASTPTPTGGATLEEVLCETTKALKVLTAQGGGTPVAMAAASPAVAAPQGDPLQTIQKHLDAIRKLNKVAPAVFKEAEERTALLDSGASHAYRPATNQAGRDEAMRVQVKLAEGEAVLHQNPGGTLLGEPKSSSSTLLPMGQLVQVLGCSIKWTPKKLMVHHPIHGALKVRVNHFCPEMAEAEALRLIAELEEIRVRQLYVATCELEKKLERAELKLTWWEHLGELVKTGARSSFLGFLQTAPFLDDLSNHDRSLMAESLPKERKDGWLLLKAMPWSRRKRRALFLIVISGTFTCLQDQKQRDRLPLRRQE